MLVLVLFALGWGRDYIPAEWQAATLALHQVIGFIVLLITIIGQGWRFGYARPAFSMPMMQKSAVSFVWGVIYISLLLLSLTGWAAASAFGLLPIGAGIEFPSVVGQDLGMAIELKSWHSFLAWFFAVFSIMTLIGRRFIRNSGLLWGIHSTLHERGGSA